MAVKKGDKVKIQYTGMFNDGTVFDSSEKHGQPLEVEIGKGMVIPGFEKALIGMEKDEEKNVKIPSAEAYGDPSPEMKKKVPKDQLPKEELKPGMMLVVGLPGGQQIPAKIETVDDGEVTLDLNHPLAGKDLNFKLKVVEICEGGCEGCDCKH